MVMCPYAVEAQNSQNLFDMTCEQVGTVVSYDMDSLASIIFHDFLYLLCMTNLVMSAAILDWNSDNKVPNANPPNGYGPYNAMEINRLSDPSPIDEETAVAYPLYNADNYVYFALEVFWRQKCPKVDFAPARPSPPGSRILRKRRASGLARVI